MNNVLEKVFANFYKLGLFAIIFLFASLTFFAKDNIEPVYQSIYHYSFIAVSFLLFFVLLFFNALKPVFFLLTLVVSYFVLNYLRNNFLLETPLYYNFGVFLITSLSLSFFVPEKRLAVKKNLIYLFVFLGIICAVEYLSDRDIFIPYNFIITSLIFAFALFLYSSVKNKVLYYGFFFAFLCVMLGYYFAFNTSAFSMFFGVALIIYCLSVAFYLYFNVVYNPVSQVKNKYAFLNYSQEKIIKCSLALICIDEMKNLQEKFGQENVNKLIFMIARIFKEKHVKVYHIKRDDFIIIFEDIDFDDAFEEVEFLRRNIATTDFLLKGYKEPLALTVSASVVERRRSDANIFAVFQRAQKDLLKRKNFNNNFTSKG